MNLIAYTFSKRVNSTKQPTNGTTIENVLLKENTSKYTPSFILNNFNREFNYIKWENRYYYINDIISLSNNHTEVQCKIDVLATYKSQITSSNAFITYSTINYDTQIPDTRLSTKDDRLIKTNSGTIYNNNGGCYFVTWIGKGATYGIVDHDSIGSLQASLLSDDILDINIVQMSDNIERKLANVCDCVTSCIYLPIKVSTGVRQNIILGGGSKTYNTAVGADTGISHQYDDSVTINIPYNFASNDFRNRSQYSSLNIYLPGYGTTPLNIDDFIGQTSITINATLDPFNGELSYRIGNLYKFTCNIGVPYQLVTSVSNGLSSILSGGASVALGAAMGGLAGGAIALASAGFNAIQSDLSRNNGTIGSHGGATSWNLRGNNIYLTVVSHDTTIEPSSMATNYGRPLNAVANIPNSGYIQTANASVSINANESICNEVNNYLNGGVFIE